MLYFGLDRNSGKEEDRDKDDGGKGGQERHWRMLQMSVWVTKNISAAWAFHNCLTSIPACKYLNTVHQVAIDCTLRVLC